MENLEKELNVLEAIEATPFPPQGIPGVFTDKRSKVKIPVSVRDYLDKSDIKIDLDEEGKLDHQKYLELLKEHNISTIGHSVIRLVPIGMDNETTR